MFIEATGEKSAEMVTDEGAIYVTSNKGYNWKAAIQETVSATLNRFLITLTFWFSVDGRIKMYLCWKFVK